MAVKAINNIFYENAAFGLQLSGPNTKNWVIANNTFANQKDNAGLIFQEGAGAAQVYNNIFYQNAYQSTETNGIHFTGASGGTIVQNNLFYTTKSVQQIDSPSMHTASNNLFNVDPKFVNAAARDFHLQSGSPAIDFAHSAFSPSIDFDGRSRPQGIGYDSGAFEFASSSTPPPPPPPPAPPPSAPSLTFSASPASIPSGQSATLSWSSTNASSCSASGSWSGTKSLSGSQSVSPQTTSTYSLSCSGSGGVVSRSVTVSVTVPPPPPPPPPSSTTLSDSDFEVEVMATNLTVPWALDFLPDGRMIFTERTGSIKLREQNGQINAIAQIASLYSGGQESGVMGLAVDPDFNNTNHVYVMYTRSTGNRSSRFNFNGSALVSETVILDGIPASSRHDGGRLKFGPDGKLYATTGDAADSSLSQNLNSLAGKILRLNKNGSIPSDNPFGSFVWTYGHRNPQGLAWGSGAVMFAAEHGESANDELNIITKGNNYGWPNIECVDSSSSVTQPIKCFTSFTMAPSGIAIYNGDVYMSGLRGGQLRRVVLNSSNQTILDHSLFANYGRLREAVQHNGYLYITTSNRDGRGSPIFSDDRIIRLRLKSLAPPPPTPPPAPPPPPPPPPPFDTTAPSTPTLSATGSSSGTVSLTWTSSSDNVGVVKYNLHRSTSSGFTPAFANRIWEPMPTASSFTDTGLAASTYFYKITAQDAAGNISTPSNQATGIVTTLTPPPPPTPPPTPPPPPPPPVSTVPFSKLYEAESATLTSSMTKGSDPLTSGGMYISPTSGSNSINPLREASLSFSLSNSGTYYLWARIMGPDESSDALYVGVDSSWDRVYPSSINLYEWVRVETGINNGQTAFSLAAGSHILQIGRGELRARIDALYLTSNISEVPPTISTSTPPPPPAPALTFSVSTASIQSNQSVSLSWSSVNTTSCVAAGAWSGSKNLSGTETITLSATGTFNLNCSGNGSTVSKSVTVTVAPPPPVNQKPRGLLEDITEGGTVFGWAQDLDSSESTISVHLYFDRNAATPESSPISLTASDFRDGIGNHAFKYLIPDSLRDGNSHQVWAWAIDANDLSGGSNTLLSGSPKSFQLAKPVREQPIPGETVDNTPPPPVSNFRAQGLDSQVALSWTNPVSSDYVRTIIVRKTDSVPFSVNDGVVIFEGTGQSLVDVSLTNAVKYYYAAFTIDRKPNYSAPVAASAVPTATVTQTPPTESLPALRLIKYPNSPTVYVIENGFKRPIADYAIYQKNFANQPIAQILPTQTYPDGTSVGFTSGTILKTPSSPTIWLITENGSRYPFRDAQEFLRFGLRFDLTRVISDQELNRYPVANFSSLALFHSTGTFVKYAGDNTVYQIRNRVKYPLTSPAVFFAHALSFSEILTIPDDITYPTGTTLTFPDGVLIKGSTPTVYLLENGKRRAFRSAQTFLDLGFTFDQIKQAPDVDLLLNEIGAPI